MHRISSLTAIYHPLWFVLALLVLAPACRTKSLALQQPSNPMDQKSYVGMMPCADCLGIATTLHLDEKGGYRHEQRYLGKSSESFVTTGSYVIDNGRLRLSPKPAAQSSSPDQFMLEGGSLRQLDMQGQVIAGGLADRYLLSAANLELNSGQRLLWVDEVRVGCTGVMEQTCLRVIRGPGHGALLAPEDADWSLLYEEIEGYEFRPGEVSLLVVQESHRSAAETPADASTIQYRIVRELARFGDSRQRLHDIWALDQIGGKVYSWQDGQKHPTLEIDVQGMSVQGNDGCNTLGGKLQELGNTAMHFGPILSTRMMCPAVMETANVFNAGLTNTRQYRLEGMKLHLLDETGRELMVLRKVD